MVEKQFQSVRGIKDYLPEDMYIWYKVESVLKSVLFSYGYNEIRLPIIEYTKLFHRAIGEITDIVVKEMYTFMSPNGDSFTLRPEGTVSCVRAVIQNGLLYKHHKYHRLWYLGPMFRYERPQKGRYRQFYQLGVEVFGKYGPDVDAELIIMTSRFWKLLGIKDYLSLELNSIGGLESRSVYCHALIEFFTNNINNFREYDYRRFFDNPMRIFDTKNKTIQSFLDRAPLITEYLDDASRIHFVGLCKILDMAGISYKINPRLVRGLDYYNRTVFEWITNELGSHKAICGGGRYDGLFNQLGALNTPAVGFAIGLDRLVMLCKLKKNNYKKFNLLDVYLIVDDPNLQADAIVFAEYLRDQLPLLHIVTNFGGGSFSKQFNRAKKFGARFILIFSTAEILLKKIIIKDLVKGYREILSKDEVVSRLFNIFKD